jgi:hypothetical protein
MKFKSLLAIGISLVTLGLSSAAWATPTQSTPNGNGSSALNTNGNGNGSSAPNTSGNGSVSKQNNGGGPKCRTFQIPTLICPAGWTLADDTKVGAGSPKCHAGMKTITKCEYY